MKSVSKKRHILKTITWRIVGTLDTMCLGWLLTGSPLIGLKIGGLELFTKMILYYFHERTWHKISLKKPKKEDYFSERNKHLDKVVMSDDILPDWVSPSKEYKERIKENQEKLKEKNGDS